MSNRKKLNSRKDRLIGRLKPVFLISACALLVLFVIGGYARRSFAADEGSYLNHSPVASPQRFAMEFKLGPYSPNIDDEFAATKGEATPFSDIFGTKTSLMLRSEFDVQVWHGFGSLAVGVSAGYYRISAPSCVSDSASGSLSSCDVRLEADQTSLTLVPLAALLVYRFDVLYERLNVPLVPYAKFGFNYTLWWMRDGNGNISRAVGEDQTATGGVFGWQTNLGIALPLDVLEPSAARTMDAEYGVNHTYLFAEFLYVHALGTPNIGDTTFLGGLALEF